MSTMFIGKALGVTTVTGDDAKAAPATRARVDVRHALDDSSIVFHATVTEATIKDTEVSSAGESSGAGAGQQRRRTVRNYLPHPHRHQPESRHFAHLQAAPWLKDAVVTVNKQRACVVALLRVAWRAGEGRSQAACARSCAPTHAPTYLCAWRGQRARCARALLRDIADHPPGL